jgi:hypothetical protein
MTKFGYMVVILLAAAVPSVVVAQQAASGDAGVVSKAQQLRLRMQVRAITDDQTMAARLSSGLEWSRLSPDQQEKIREEVLAFMGKSEAEQDKLLTHYERLIRLGAAQREAYLARAAWLRVVVDSYTPAERKAMESLPPQERAARLIERKEQLIREGKLADTATEPATR